MLVRVVGGGLLIAHGLVHLLYVADAVGEFTLEDSWLIPEAWQRSIGIALMWTTVVAFGLLGLAVRGVPGLVCIWPIVAVIGVAVLQPDWTERLHG